MKNLLKTIIFALIFFFSSILVSLAVEEGVNYHRGIVEEVISVEEIQIEGFDDVQVNTNLKVHLLEVDETVEVEVVGLRNNNIQDYSEGDRLILSEFATPDGETSFSIISYDRQNVILILFLLFLVLALIISAKRTTGAVLGLIFSFFIIFTFLIPQILSGSNPVFVSILTAMLIIPVNFYFSHGFNKKTSIAIVSTIIALVITGFLALFFMGWANITGQGLEETMLISTMVSSTINIEGLLLAGVIIGTLGVLDDVTISQVAIVQQISEVGEKLQVGEVFTRAMSIGKDHMASMINTLVLVYTGASMPLLIIFVNAQLPLNYVLSLEIVSMEIIRTLVGTIGLVSAIPISTFIATIVLKKKVTQSLEL
jgi:uncharacterized membrane protein